MWFSIPTWVIALYLAVAATPVLLAGIFIGWLLS